MINMFDLHADLALAIQGHQNEYDGAVLRNHWLPIWQKGGIGWTAAASYFGGEEDWETMKDTILLVRNDIKESGLKQILTPADLDENEPCTTVVMTIEGMCGIRKDPEESVQWMYDQGNRIGSLCWNDENALATGNDGDPARGLTDMGRAVIRKMNQLHMIVDVSHANEKTFWDILDMSELPIIASHSNCKRKCFVTRNLTDQQMQAMAEKGGLIGMNSCEDFISEDPDLQDADHLAEHVLYMADLVGLEHIACGFDFGGYYYEEDTGKDLFGPWQAQNFIEALMRAGLSEKDIRAIAYGNVMDFLRKHL
ncbi:MAG: membrane dipeptidase [Clostridia bacterium]|nr:membrane dipeptidase [Clostridia bacterium]